ncbi:MAG: LCP family protein [Bacilli bacterium]|nr:LCP family protein [Bacilli bacterium]
MKVLLKKLKKISKVKRILYYISLILYLVTFILLVKNILGLAGIETFIRVIIIILLTIWLIAYPLWNLINMLTNRKKTYVVCLIITIILSIVSGVGSYYINFGLDTVSKLTEQEYVTYTTNLIVLKGNQLSGSDTIGMIKNSKDIEGNVLAKELIKKEKLTNEIKYYEDYYDMLSDLYAGNVKAVFVSNNYPILFSNEETFQNIADETEVLYEFSKEMPNQDVELTSTKRLDEPFTVLIMGVDSEKEGLNANAAFNGDTLMVITFNPNTLTATMFSIPRDMYVPIACRNNAYNKINSSAAYGTSCVISTVEKFTDIKIDYYAKINFKGVVHLVDALGGVTVDVGKDFCEQNSNRNRENGNEICLKAGEQNLNGEQALAFARHRKTLLRGDIDRGQNQQMVVQALAQKVLQLKDYNDFKKVLDTVSNNIATNMNTNSILSFYNVLKDMLSKSLNDEEFISIKKTYLEYYSLPVYLKSSNMYTAALGYYPDSLEAIKKAMKVNLELEKEEMIKTFSYSINEDYTGKVIGKGIYGGNKEGLVPSFIGKSLSAAQNWASSNGIRLESVTVNSGDAKFDSSLSTGLITSQSVHEGSFVKDISSITVYVNGVNNNVVTNNSATKVEDNINEEEDNNYVVKQKEDKKEETATETTEKDDNTKKEDEQETKVDPNIEDMLNDNKEE